MSNYTKITDFEAKDSLSSGDSNKVIKGAEFETEFDIDEVKMVLSEMSGITLSDDPLHNLYPMPITAEGKNDVFVGRIRRDESQPKTLNLWIVSDNLRKGAATNAVQIAKHVASLI